MKVSTETDQSDVPGALNLFFSYSHRDEVLRDELARHLKNLEREGMIRTWHDRRIDAGREWEGEISENLEKADIVLLLISSDFIASDYCYDREMTRALELHDAGETRVIPVILRPMDWQTERLARLQALPTDAKPVTEWTDQDTAFLDVTRGIRRVVEEVRGRGRGLAPDDQRPPSPPPARRKPTIAPALMFIAVPLVLALLVAWILFWARFPRMTAGQRPGVAVLTLANLSGDLELDWLGVALSEYLNAELSLDAELRVVEQQETNLMERSLFLGRSFPGLEIGSEDLGRIRKLLGADHVVTGEYQAVGGNSTVRVELAAYGADSGRLDTRRRTGEVGDWLAIAGRISGAGSSPGLRKVLGAEPRDGDSDRLAAWFPRRLDAAEPYFSGLVQSRRREDRAAWRLFVQAGEAEPNILVFRAQSFTALALGEWEDAERALEQAERILAGSRSRLPTYLARQMELELALLRSQLDDQPDQERELRERIYRDYFSDDLLYGLTYVSWTTRDATPRVSSPGCAPCRSRTSIRPSSSPWPTQSSLRVTMVRH